MTTAKVTLREPDYIDLGKDGSIWKHGYIPENAAAVALKEHHKVGAAAPSTVKAMRSHLTHDHGLRLRNNAKTKSSAESFHARDHARGGANHDHPAQDEFGHPQDMKPKANSAGKFIPVGTKVSVKPRREGGKTMTGTVTEHRIGGTSRADYEKATGKRATGTEMGATQVVKYDVKPGAPAASVEHRVGDPRVQQTIGGDWHTNGNALRDHHPGKVQLKKEPLPKSVQRNLEHGLPPESKVIESERPLPTKKIKVTVDKDGIVHVDTFDKNSLPLTPREAKHVTAIINDAKTPHDLRSKLLNLTTAQQHAAVREVLAQHAKGLHYLKAHQADIDAGGARRSAVLNKLGSIMPWMRGRFLQFKSSEVHKKVAGVLGNATLDVIIKEGLAIALGALITAVL